MLRSRLHVPRCEASTCDDSLDLLTRDLQEQGVSVVEYNICGHYRDEFKSNFERCPLTILHKCSALWDKLLKSGALKLLKKHNKKIVCVQVIEPVSPQTNNPGTDFFTEFCVLNITTEQKVKDFVQKIISILSESDTHRKNRFAPRPMIPPRPPTLGVAPSSSTSNVFDYLNAPMTDESMLNTLKDLVALEKNSSGDDYAVMCSNALTTSNSQRVQVKILNREQMNEHLLSLDDVRNFPELRALINDLLKDPQSQAINLSFLLHKMLPELYNSNSVLGITTMALCDYDVLHKSAIVCLELLILRGQIANSFIDRSKLQSIQGMLAESVHLLSKKYQKQPSVMLEASMKRMCHVILLLNSEQIDLSSEDDDLEDFDAFNRQLGSMLAKLKTTRNIEKHFKTVVSILSIPFEKIIKSINKFGSIDYRDECETMSRSLLKKRLPVQWAVIFQCLKKLFSRMDIIFLVFIENYLNAKRKLVLNPPAVPPVVTDLLVRGLTHFLSSGLREAAHRNIQEHCIKVVEILKIVSSTQQALPNEICQLLRPLMFESTPAIRQTVIDLLQQQYNNQNDVMFIEEVEFLLFPFLKVEIDPVKKRMLTETTHECQWLSLSGQFNCQDVIIYIHKPYKTDHINHNRSQFTEQQDAVHLKVIKTLTRICHHNIIQLFAYSKNTIPLFYVTEDYRTTTAHGSANLQEYLVNRSINQSFCREKTLLKFLLQVTSALDYCHDSNIVHNNLTAESLLMAGEENIKLGCFQLAVDMGNSSETIIEDRCLQPIRWSAPETIKLSVSTPKTDVYMVGHLMYEVLSHGVLPYSHKNISDVECVIQIFHSAIKLNYEKCIQQEHFRTIEGCTQFYPRHRPSVKEIRSRIDNFIKSAKSEPIYPQWYPNLTNGNCKPSTEFKRGLPDLDAITTPTKCITKINETLSQYKMGNTYLMREIVPHVISKEMIEKVHSGMLDDLIPRIIITPYINKEHIIDIHIPCSCSSMLEFVSDKKNGCTVDTCILLLLKVVEMVQHFHELSFVLGDIRASLIYVENKDGDFKLYPVSLHYLCDKPGQNFTSNQLKPPYQSVAFIRMSPLPYFSDFHLQLRAAPEFKEKGVCNASTDIFNIGALMMDVFVALNSDIDFQNEDCLNYIPLADIMESDMSADVFTKPLQCPTTLFILIQKCMHVKPRKRPTTGHIISVLEREVIMTTSQLNTFNPSDSSSSDTSSFALVPELHRPFQVMNPSDTYSDSSDDTWCYHQSVDSLSTIYNEVDVEEDNKNMFSDIYIEPVDYFLLERRVSSQTLPKILDETMYSLGKDMSYSIIPEMSNSITPEVSHSITPEVSRAITPEVSRAINPEVSHAITPEVKSGEAEHKLNTPNYFLDPKSRLSEISMFPSNYLKYRPLPAIPEHAKQSLTAKVPVQNIFSSPKPHLVVAGYDDEEPFIKTPFSQNKGNATQDKVNTTQDKVNTTQNKVNTTQNNGAYGKEAYIPMALFATPVENAIPHKLIPYQRKGYTDLNPITMADSNAPQYLYKNFRLSSVPALSLPYLSNQDISNINVNTFLTPELCPQHPKDRAPIQQSAEFCATSRKTQEPLEASQYLSEAELALSGCVAENDVVYVRTGCVAENDEVYV